MNQLDRVIYARSRVIIEAQRLVNHHPREHTTLELALLELHDAERAKALRKAELTGVIRSLPRDAA